MHILVNLFRFKKKLSCVFTFNKLRIRHERSTINKGILRSFFPLTPGGPRLSKYFVVTFLEVLTPP